MADTDAASSDSEEEKELTEEELQALLERQRKEDGLLAKTTDATLSEVQEFREIFQLVDLDRGGSIDAEELGSLMELMGMDVTEDEVEEIMSEIDTTGSGEIYFPDFVKTMAKKPKVQYSASNVIAAFEKFAGPNQPNGCIKPEQLADALMQFEGGLERQQAEEIVRKHEKDRHGLIHYAEYVNMMMSDASSRADTGDAKIDTSVLGSPSAVAGTGAVESAVSNSVAAASGGDESAAGGFGSGTQIGDEGTSGSSIGIVSGAGTMEDQG